MNLYKHKRTGKLYTIEHLVQDIYYLTNKIPKGIYAHPYHWSGEISAHTFERMGGSYNPEEFIFNNFEKVTENAIGLNYL